MHALFCASFSVAYFVCLILFNCTSDLLNQYHYYDRLLDSEREKQVTVKLKGEWVTVKFNSK